MKTTILSIIGILIILSSTALALHGFKKDPAYAELDVNRKGVERLTHFDPRIQNQQYSWKATIALEPKAPPITSPGYPTKYPRGTAYIGSSRYGKETQGGITIQVHELPTSTSKDYLFESWLVDDDTEYWLSIGVFDTVGRGTGEVEQQRLNRYLDYYDRIIITREPYPDPNPAPSNEIVLLGTIKKPTPEPHLKPQNVQQKLWGTSNYFPSGSATS